MDAGRSVDADVASSRHVPGLDGIRGVAVAAVLFYHSPFRWMRGGFLGVSTFFTLSGFLIAGLVKDEIRSTGRLDLRRFWSRRARRLLPAALLTLAGIIAFRNSFGAISYGRLRGDTLAALGYAENWWLIGTHQSYGSIFGTASPLQHFWSLAIEEQFYVVFPILCYALHRLLHDKASVAVVFGGCAVASFTVSAWLTHGGDVTRSYYGADSRAAELLVGVVLAYIVSSSDVHPSRRARRAADSAGVVGLVILIVLWSRIDFGSSLLFRGGTALNAACTAAIIVACVRGGLVSALLSLRPLQLLGRISYGVYLAHWPIFLWLTPSRTGSDGWALFALRSTLVLAVTVPLFLLVERPIRTRVALRGWAFGLVTATATATIAAVTLYAIAPQRLVIDLASAPSVDKELGALAATRSTGARRILVIGDSLGWTVFVGLREWGRAHHVAVGNYTAVGCGTGGPGTLDYLGVQHATDPDCAKWHSSLRTAVARFRPDAVVIVMGLADLSPRQFAKGQFLSIGDPTFDRRQVRRAIALTGAAGSGGASVVWATYPHVDVRYTAGATGQPPFVENDPTRVDRLNALIRETVAVTPGTSIVDFGAYCRDRPGGEFDPGFRPDGVHLYATSTREVASWLGPLLTDGPPVD